MSIKILRTTERETEWMLEIAVEFKGHDNPLKIQIGGRGEKSVKKFRI